MRVAGNPLKWDAQRREAKAGATPAYSVKEEKMLRTFHFERVEDVNGVSGVGRVAEGIEFNAADEAMQ